MGMRRASRNRRIPSDLPLMFTGQGVASCPGPLLFSGCLVPLGQLEVVGVASGTWPGVLATGWLRLAQQPLWAFGRLCHPVLRGHSLTGHLGRD